MGLILHIIVSPVAGYFMTLIWAASFGNVCDTLTENTMMEEWLICIQIYIGIVLIVTLKRKFGSDKKLER